MNILRAPGWDCSLFIRNMSLGPEKSDIDKCHVCCTSGGAVCNAGVGLSTELGTALINAYCKGGAGGMRHAERVLQLMLVRPL